jgi:hypothetical protein
MVIILFTIAISVSYTALIAIILSQRDEITRFSEGRDLRGGWDTASDRARSVSTVFRTSETANEPATPLFDRDRAALFGRSVCEEIRQARGLEQLAVAFSDDDFYRHRIAVSVAVARQNPELSGKEFERQVDSLVGSDLWRTAPHKPETKTMVDDVVNRSPDDPRRSDIAGILNSVDPPRDAFREMLFGGDERS